MREIVVLGPFTIAAGTTKVWFVAKPSFAGRIYKARLCNDATVTANATNYTTVTIMVYPTGTDAWQLDTSATGLTADTFRDLTEQNAPVGANFQTDDTIVFSKAESGTGAALTDAFVYLEITRRER